MLTQDTIVASTAGYPLIICKSLFIPHNKRGAVNPHTAIRETVCKRFQGFEPKRVARACTARYANQRSQVAMRANLEASRECANSCVRVCRITFLGGFTTWLNVQLFNLYKCQISGRRSEREKTKYPASPCNEG
eukprot:1151210-Pelagomonas_calceolata.AAC.1